MNSNFETCYVSCGCNKTPHAADWGSNGLICFASCNSVAIYDPSISGEGGKITHTLHGHTERVNCVRWLKSNTVNPAYEFVSASADGTAILWSWCNKVRRFSQELKCEGHTNIVSVADGLIKMPMHTNYVRNESSVIIATASVDSTVRIWERNDTGDVGKCVDIIHWKSGFCLDVKLSFFPNTNLILLACAADDNKVHLFIETKKSEIEGVDSDHRFQKVHVLIGHDDWVRSMDFLSDENNNLYLATASQDTYVRIYKFQRNTERRNAHSKPTNSSPISKGVLEPEETIIKVGSGYDEHHFSIILETVLAGHEGWVYGVSWHPPIFNPLSKSTAGQNMEITGALKSQKIKLLSISMDKTMIVWSPDKTGLWSEEARVGEVGGNMLGFYGGKFGPGGRFIMGHGYQGSFHIWSFDKENKNWEPKVVVGGHTGEVMDMSWDTKGNYVLTVGGDQTTRLHAPWVRSDGNKITWHEIARPQIHGYDMNCLAVISEYKFASGAEEKVIRAFTAPNNFVENFRRISNIKLESPELKGENLPQGASVPALGLSNKPVFEQMKKEGYLVDDEYPDLYFSPIHLKKPPTEENLMQNTLWPEAQKLYGHGYEIYSLAARKDGLVLASSCKAANSDHAAIILWNAKTWLLLQKLLAHQLTVTQMSFSPDGKYLLSVSRDRRWSLFGLKEEETKFYQLLATANPEVNFHTRVIWCCSWTHDSSIFATGSRDGKVGFWNPVATSETSKIAVNLLASLESELQKESVTALAFAPVLIRNFHILAVGLESGKISLYRYFESVVESLWVSFGRDLGHSLTVKRLAFRPKVGRAGVSQESDANDSNVIQLASCGSDHVLKIYDLYLNSL